MIVLRDLSVEGILLFGLEALQREGEALEIAIPADLAEALRGIERSRGWGASSFSLAPAAGVVSR